ncbi:hypothetical protein T439DRAFT_329121 [Meredithblackwellia eburnea MCA 4105]
MAAEPIINTTNGADNKQEVDVLIVGAGPSGLMLATWLSKLKIKTRVVDKRGTKVFTGQADGVQCRTVEVFQSFGFAERLVKEGAHINEVVFWNPSPEAPEGEKGIVRTKRTADNEPGTSRFPHAVLTQGRIERFMLDSMKEFDNLTVERSLLPTSLSLAPSTSLTDYPITVTLRHLTEEEATPTQVGTVPNGMFRSNLMKDDSEDARVREDAKVGETETVKAKFVVGCDGARSWVRKELGLALSGDSANVYWGVIDVLPLTNFPDIRLKCTIHSEKEGSVLIVPREKGLVRFYVQLGDTEAGSRVDRTAITPESIIAKAKAIMAPYELDCPFIEWWTVYEIGQRICTTVSKDNRIFLAGDAFHTHSPKAGQGMNISMMDTYNLGWKLAGVLKGTLQPSILDTYTSERVQTAQELIDLDWTLSRLFSGKKTGKDKEESVEDKVEFRDFFIKLGKWASGTACQYKPSPLCIANDEAEKLAAGLPLGMRFESQQVVSIADARPWHLADRFESDGRFRVVIFAGDLRKKEKKNRLAKVAAYLDSPSGPLRKYTPKNGEIDSVVEVITVMSNPRISVEPNDFPDVLWPAKGQYGVRDYCKLYADDDTYFAGHGHIYEKLKIDPVEGCLVVVRPDQYVAQVTRVDEFEKLGSFFDAFMIEQH